MAYIIKDKKGLLGLKDSPFDKGKKTLEILINDAKLMKVKDTFD